MVVMEASDVTVRIGDAILLDRVGFAVEAGRFSAILGPNGAGKSTLMKVLAGSLQPTAGRVWLWGKTLREWPRRETSQLRAVLSQRTDLTFPFTVRDVVLLGRSPYAGHSRRDTDLAVVNSTMKMCGISHLSRRVYPTLSGDEQQRVQLARVLAQLHRNGTNFEDCSGQVLLLDEPTSSLDIAHQHAILTLARALAGRGMAVVAVLHDLNQAVVFADSVHLMKDARFVEAGPPAEIIRPDSVKTVFDIDVRMVSQAGESIRYVVPAP